MPFTEPGKFVFVLRTRRGFARIALEQSASLVPVILFEEVDLYEANTKYGQLVRVPMERPLMCNAPPNRQCQRLKVCMNGTWRCAYALIRN